MKKIVHNTETGEITEVEMTEEDLANLEAARKAEADKLAEEADKAAKKAELLAKLGLTEDEAKLLLS